MNLLSCRLCDAPLSRTFVDLGMSPPCERILSADELDQGETFYPLHVRLCENCLLVQLPADLPAEDIFVDYAYFSSFSDSWVAHARRFVDGAVQRLGLTRSSLSRSRATTAICSSIWPLTASGAWESSRPPTSLRRRSTRE